MLFLGPYFSFKVLSFPNVLFWTYSVRFALGKDLLWLPLELAASSGTWTNVDVLQKLYKTSEVRSHSILGIWWSSNKLKRYFILVILWSTGNSLAVCIKYFFNIWYFTFLKLKNCNAWCQHMGKNKQIGLITRKMIQPFHVWFIKNVITVHKQPYNEKTVVWRDPSA